MKVIRCDHCGKVMDGGIHYTIEYQRTSHSEVDLCRRCFKTVDEFLTSYKRYGRKVNAQTPESSPADVAEDPTKGNPRSVNLSRTGRTDDAGDDPRQIL